MKPYLSVQAVLFLFIGLGQIACQQTPVDCVKCTPCGEQQGLERLKMLRASTGTSNEGGLWVYEQDKVAWTTVSFNMNPRKNFIGIEQGSPHHIYIIELVSSDAGAQPEYYWIDSTQTQICSIPALEHPRRGYNQFYTLIYK